MPSYKITSQTSIKANPNLNYKIDTQFLDIYTDYLISGFGLTTATGLSQIISISNDQVGRFLGGITTDSKGKVVNRNVFSSKDLWKLIKPILRENESQNGCILIDDTIIEKPCTDENDMVSWHFDHCSGKQVKGVNLLNYIYLSYGHNGEIAIPIDFDLIEKIETVWKEDKNGKTKEFRVSAKTKNEMLREKFLIFLHNQIMFQYILMDTWFACQETLNLINHSGKYYITPTKANRSIALTEYDKTHMIWSKIEDLNFENGTVKTWLKGVDHPVLIIKQIFTNQDGSTAIRFLITNDLNLNQEEISTTYHKRWTVEEYHKSLKSLLGLEKSPTKNLVTQSNHFFCSIMAFLKMEILTKYKKVKGGVKDQASKFKNHFQLKSQIYVAASKVAFKEVMKLKSEVESLRLLGFCER